MERGNMKRGNMKRDDHKRVTGDLEICDMDFANPAHCAGLVRVLDSYASGPVGGGKPLSAEVRQRLVPALRELPSARIVLAFRGDQPVGLAICFLAFSTFHARPLLNIHDLAVVPEHRGQGVGRALLEAVETRARQGGCVKLTLEVQESNRRAWDFYLDFGFADFEIAGPTPTRFLSKPLA